MDQHINLYLDLEPGELADLEVVARASLAFAGAVREIAYIVDPSLVIRLELESGTEGSLSLNSVIRFVRQQVSDPVTRKVIIIGIVMWFAKETGSALLGVAVNDLIAHETTISEQDAQRIAEKVQELLDKKVAAKPVQEVYKELQKDKSIKGVGVSTEKGARPRSVVPREQFPERSQAEAEDVQEGEPRNHTERMILTLISPVLQNNKNKWRFLSKDGNINAGIKDEKFLNSILSGQSDLKMRSGIILIADVEITERKKDGVWQVTERNVSNVVEIRTEDDINDLFSSE
ncbi:MULTISPECIES: hypothetical protein [unclassified Mesorhizobium]|uniref:hypothetical protein n=1 Tax=unclassified Mesorhizobium TaxID=325217 RepID=UPI0010934756|nr:MULTISPECIES: hypothetical protein [unclassified Mesorhizobium]TGS37806.1 hypothetical protein EN825_31020 [Mesorhizobium sp. M8A.F.Ca.ET.182.01.1.1]TGS76721.1 hypothetical protein EN824_30375 [Mesorhizobium sp. M8A.F.Ca.ET.181.01.1.1]